MARIDITDRSKKLTTKEIEANAANAKKLQEAWMAKNKVEVLPEVWESCDKDHHDVKEDDDKHVQKLNKYKPKGVLIKKLERRAKLKTENATTTCSCCGAVFKTELNELDSPIPRCIECRSYTGRYLKSIKIHGWEDFNKAKAILDNGIPLYSNIVKFNRETIESLIEQFTFVDKIYLGNLTKVKNVLKKLQKVLDSKPIKQNTNTNYNTNNDSDKQKETNMLCMSLYDIQTINNLLVKDDKDCYTICIGDMNTCQNIKFTYKQAKEIAGSLPERFGFTNVCVPENTKVVAFEIISFDIVCVNHMVPVQRDIGSRMVIGDNDLFRMVEKTDFYLVAKIKPIDGFECLIDGLKNGTHEVTSGLTHLDTNGVHIIKKSVFNYKR